MIRFLKKREIIKYTNKHPGLHGLKREDNSQSFKSNNMSSVVMLLEKFSSI